MLILKTVNKDGTAYGGFKWPLKVGAHVKAPDWNSGPVCGGLHGFAWGEGDGRLADWSADARWIVFEYRGKRSVDLGGKVKVPSAVIRHVGNQRSATDYIATHGGDGRAIVGGTATAGVRGTATAGDGGTATAGYGGTATAGYGGEIRIRWYDGERYRLAVGYVGEDVIEANVPYEVANGKLVKA